ncbi:MAG: rod shape-determining protein MreD [Candidatus Omnitrophica bacterium]|nr:rod shape-determining protein MreD [Candidatus Omnitrophota bacterium]
MKKLIFITAIIIAGLLQATVLNYISIFNVKPDLLLSCAVIASLIFSAPWAVFFSIFSGILQDILSVNAFGIHTILFALWSILIIKLSRKISFDNDYMKIALLAAVVLFNNIIIRLVFLFLNNFISWGIFLRITFIDSLYTVLIFPLILKFARSLSLINE